MVFGDRAARRHPVDGLRKHLRKAARRLFLRNAELLRDLAEFTLTEDLRRHVGVDRHVLAGADPRVRLLPVAGLLQLAEHAGEPAVLLQQLQHDLQQRALRLCLHRQLRAAHHAAHHLTQQSVQESHGAPRTLTGRLVYLVRVRASRALMPHVQVRFGGRIARVAEGVAIACWCRSTPASSGRCACTGAPPAPGRAREVDDLDVGRRVFATLGIFASASFSRAIASSRRRVCVELRRAARRAGTGLCEKFWIVSAKILSLPMNVRTLSGVSIVVAKRPISARCLRPRRP